MRKEMQQIMERLKEQGFTLESLDAIPDKTYNLTKLNRLEIKKEIEENIDNLFL